MQNATSKILILSMFLTASLFLSCSKKDESNGQSDVTEVAQQVGDVMASIDESGGGSSSLAMISGEYKSLVQHEPQKREFPFLEMWAEKAQAAICSNSTFSTCSSNEIIRTFAGCTLGGATYDGTVSLKWADGSTNNVCAVTTTGHTITRDPNFEITGRRGGVLTVKKSGSIGQRLTFDGSNSFAFTNDGIRRTISVNSQTLYDYTTETTSAITITGINRVSRTLSGGTLKITNHLSSVTCSISPSGLTWVSTCTCPTSGSWSGTCSDGKTFTLTAQSTCGSASLTLGSDGPQTLTFDRCGTP